MQHHEHQYVEPWWRRTGLASGAVVTGLSLWAVSMVHSYLRLNLWVLDWIVVPTMWVCFVVGFVLVVLGFAMRGWTGLIGVVAVVPIMAVVTAAVGAWWWVSPRAWFASHRALYEHALKVEIADGYYASLPAHLRFLTERGTVSQWSDGARFFPQWTGIPDDAGGFIHSPSGSPEGRDMYGMGCRAPVSLGGDWWMCGLTDR